LTTKIMKLRLLVIPVLVATALFAQGPGALGGRRGLATSATPPPPPTPEQLATREVNTISTALRLTTTQTSALLADLACASSATTVTPTTPCALTAAQNVLQANAATLKTDWATLSTELSSTPPGSTATTVTAINGVELSNLDARVAAAGAVLTEFATLKVTLTSNQETTLVNILIRGGGRGFFRR
jgi:hypothetical protein